METLLFLISGENGLPFKSVHSENNYIYWFKKYKHGSNTAYCGSSDTQLMCETETNWIY